MSAPKPKSKPKRKYVRQPGSNRPGQPFTLTPELIEKVTAYLRTGAYVETAVLACGVPKVTFYSWLKRANLAREAGTKAGPEDALCLKFLNAVEKVMAESELQALSQITLAATTNWQAAAWRLERKYPDRWGRKDRVEAELSGPGGGPIGVTQKPDLAKVLTKDELAAAYAISAKLHAGGDREGAGGS